MSQKKAHRNEMFPLIERGLQVKLKKFVTFGGICVEENKAYFIGDAHFSNGMRDSIR
jgi:hypothetical protein